VREIAGLVAVAARDFAKSAAKQVSDDSALPSPHPGLI
jgi:hypothetical protein